MKAYISFIDLCQEVALGSQPERIYVNGTWYNWSKTFGNYFDSIGFSLFGNNKFEDLCGIMVAIDEGILDDKEKEYLSAVIRPFRDMVNTISKAPNSVDGTENIVVSFKCDGSLFLFPPFKKGEMYKGMEPCHGYTLEELGL